jgi:uncharacterized membrane protein
MKRTSASVIVLLAALGGAAGWFLEVARVASGAPVVVPPYTLAVVLGLIGVIIVIYALPVWRVVNGTAKKSVDPFYATRVVLLAKASSLTGALVGGFALGVVAFLLSRSVITGGTVAMAAFTTLGAAMLLAGGLIAEKMCTLPPDDDSPDTATPRA